jgi:hypothetical protein
MTNLCNAVMEVRLKRLPPRHRIAHLRALIGQESAPSIRRFELAALLRAEMAAESCEDGCP